jgi:hypothetical protein
MLMVIVFALSRWPGLMPINFSAAYAIVFCAGVYFPGRWGGIIPLAVMALTDLVLKLLFYRQVEFTAATFIAQEAPVLLAYAGLFGLGRFFGAKKSWWMLLGGGIIGAILFYIVTNTAAWLSLPYAKTIGGWLQAITTGFPGYPQTWEFFRNTLLSGGLFTGLFVGAMKATEESEETETEEEEKPEEEPQAEPAETES